MAQKVANALADVFRANNVERTTQNSTRAEDLLAREIAAYQEKIRFDTEALFNYAREKGLPPSMDQHSECGGAAFVGFEPSEFSKPKKNARMHRQYISAPKTPGSLFRSRRYEIDANQPTSSNRISQLREKKAALEVTYTKEWPEVKRSRSFDQASRD